MSHINHAGGGDGWSNWTVDRLASGAFEVQVTSRAEVRGGKPVEIFHSRDIRDGNRAIDKALSESSAYAYRMFQ